MALKREADVAGMGGGDGRPARGFFERDAVTVARALLGQRLVRVLDGVRLSGLIVETEAYLGAADRAAHTFGGRRTARNEPMWQSGGTAYVYFTYGMHHCFNVTAGKSGEPVAVLVRALEPREGIARMRAHRSSRVKPGQRLRERDLCSGPAKLCEALAIDRRFSGVDMLEDGALFIEQVRRRAMSAKMIATTARIGVGYAGDWAEKPLRFVVKGHACASR